MSLDIIRWTTFAFHKEKARSVYLKKIYRSQQCVQIEKKKKKNARAVFSNSYLKKEQFYDMSIDVTRWNMFSLSQEKLQNVSLFIKKITLQEKITLQGKLHCKDVCEIVVGGFSQAVGPKTGVDIYVDFWIYWRYRMQWPVSNFLQAKAYYRQYNTGDVITMRQLSTVGRKTKSSRIS